MDENLGYLISLLKGKGLYEDINIVIVSDHGMTTMNSMSTIYIQNYTSLELINSTRTVYGPTTNLHPIEGSVRMAKSRRIFKFIYLFFLI